MGPVIIFDKSTLESLNPDEAVWLDQFFLSNITPLFFVETLADLEKNLARGRTPEQIVGSLAYKTPDFSSKPNAYHRLLLEGELLLGATLDLENGLPHISGGKQVELEGKTGVVFSPSPEEEAFARWQDYEFLDLERSIAKHWRRALSNLNLEQQYQAFQSLFPLGKPKTLEGVKRFVDFYMDGPDQERLLRLGLTLVGFENEAQAHVLQRWRATGRQPVKVFVPYFAYVLSVDLFFYLAIAADLIARTRPSHKIDLAYLYYMPFCMVFTSNDQLHAAIAPFFLRQNQTFLKGTDLKADLAALDAHYSGLPDEEKARGVVRFASLPPISGEFLVTKLWDKHMASSWRASDATSAAKPELGEQLFAQIKKMEEADASQRQVPTQQLDSMVIRRSVRPKKGKWMRLPPEVLKSNKE